MAKKLAPVHPGEILFEEYMTPLGLSANRLALDLHVPATRITAIINGARAITADTAMRLARYFTNMSARFWLDLQADYDLDVAEDTLAEKIKREVHAYAAAS